MKQDKMERQISGHPNCVVPLCPSQALVGMINTIMATWLLMAIAGCNDCMSAARYNSKETATFVNETDSVINLEFFPSGRFTQVKPKSSSTLAIAIPYSITLVVGARSVIDTMGKLGLDPVNVFKNRCSACGTAIIG